VPSRVLSLVAPLVAACALVACSSDKSPDAAPSSSSEATTTSTTSTTTAPPPTTADPIVPAGSAEDAASAFIGAWRNGDQAEAAAIATPAAVQAVFGAGAPGHVENRGCNTPPVAGPVLCVYRTGAGELQVRVQPRPDGWYVDQAIVSGE
jgi:hypothetical protein